MAVTAEIAGTVAELRLTVAGLPAELTRNELVAWTAGNVSARVPGQDLMVIKPSGVSYHEIPRRPWSSRTWQAS
jgi:L-ribulose-5-phosphate 4-epimerase